MPDQTFNAPVISSVSKKRMGSGRIIWTLLGVFLLVVSMGAGIILTSQRQLFQQKAAANAPVDCNNKYGKDCVYDNGCIWDGCLKWLNGVQGGTCEEWGTERYSSCEQPSEGGSVCIGCYGPGNTNQGLYGVTHLGVTRSNDTSAKLTWTYGSGRMCPKRAETVIFIGRNKAAVESNCGLSPVVPAGNKNGSDVDAPNPPTPGKGGGGRGGTAGGGAATAGAANTGGGGGGGPSGAVSQPGANGGSGIVIVRFPDADADATGGAVSRSGGFEIHSFKNVGASTLTITRGSTTKAEILVVGGGGGGGLGGGGGGGAGGVIHLTGKTLTARAYNINVGAGGVFADITITAGCTENHPQWRTCPNGDGRGGHGGNSSISPIDGAAVTAVGGGGGGSAGKVCSDKSCFDRGHTGAAGGSGGGATYDNAGSTAGGGGTAGQGNKGGASQEGSTIQSSLGAGGGGGATQAGSNGNISRSGGAGGDGLCTDISGENKCYGGGGSGASGGFGSTLIPGCTYVRTVASDVKTYTASSANGTALAAGVTYYFRVVAHYQFTQTFPNHPGEEEDQGQWCGASNWSPTISTPTPTPTAPPTAQCSAVKAYDASWAALTNEQLAALSVGTKINFCVNGTASDGTFDKAKFTINGVAQPEVTAQPRPGSTDFCQEYTIPADVTSFNVTAQIHHSILGWSL